VFKYVKKKTNRYSKDVVYSDHGCEVQCFTKDSIWKIGYLVL